jgi:hypothetical protein
MTNTTRYHIDGRGYGIIYGYGRGYIICRYHIGVIPTVYNKVTRYFLEMKSNKLIPVPKTDWSTRIRIKTKTKIYGN